MLFARHYGQPGRTVFVLHGGPGAAGHMAPLARRLSDTYRVVEPFQRGSGGEPLTVATHIADLHEAIETHAGGARPVLLGSSWGAMLALAYAAEHPDTAGPLILVGCGTFDPVSRAAMKRSIAERTNDQVRAELALADQLTDPNERLKAQAAVIAALYSVDLAEPPHADDTIDAQAQHETWDDMLRLQAEGKYPAAFAAITSPVLMLHGEHDPHPGRLIRDNLAPLLPQLIYREFAHCGHYPWLERAAAGDFYRLVNEWLDKQTAQ
jgi:pimeloyl-ACP methyl ester carboxylesterase